MLIKKANLGSHFGSITNLMSFDQAYDYILQNPDKIFYTTGNNTLFISEARKCKKGPNKGNRVIIFKTKTNKDVNTEKARSYKCCWDHKTNCNKTHIDCFTMALNP
jgi:hypothetical protein